MDQKIPLAAVYRLAAYSRFLSQLEANHVYQVSSREIAEGVDSTPAKVRKDLSYFGDFGKRGVGYEVTDLNIAIKKILGVNRRWKTIIIGAGHLGSALARYDGFKKRGYDIEAMFDVDVKKIGTSLNDCVIQSIDNLEGYIQNNNIELAILAVPSWAAQSAANRLGKTDIQGVLNFAPTKVILPEHIILRNLELTVELEIISFMIKHGTKPEETL